MVSPVTAWAPRLLYTEDRKVGLEERKSAMYVFYRSPNAVIQLGTVENRFMTRPSFAVAVLAACLPAAWSQTMQAPDLTKTPTLYVVPYAHLDTQWRWEFPQTISEYLLKTMRVNFDFIEKYPHYVFNWTGANRYRLMKEYFPSDYAK